MMGQPRHAGGGNDAHAFVARDDSTSPWRHDAADSDLARSLGVNEIGRGGSPGATRSNHRADHVDADRPDAQTLADNDFDGEPGDDDTYDV